jgi:hypothetical protein
MTAAWQLLRRHPFVLLPWAFYLATASPTIGMGDTAMLVQAIDRLRISSWVNNHNLSVIAGWLLSQLPLGTPAYQANLLSVVFGGATIVAFYVLVFSTFRSRWVAALSASALAVSHSQWWHSTITEVYAINGLFTVLFLHLLWQLERGATRGALYLLFFLAGLSIFNHVQMGILGVGAAVFLGLRLIEHVRAGRGAAAAREFAACLGFCLAGFLPYLFVLVRDIRAGDGSYGLSTALGGGWSEIMLGDTWSTGLQDVSFLLVQQFPSPYLIAVLWGTWLVLRRGRAVDKAVAGAVAALLLNTGFFAFFPTWDKFAFLLPSFIILAFFGAFALDQLRRRMTASRSRWWLAAAAAATLLLPPWVYSQMGGWAHSNPFLRRRFQPAYMANMVDHVEFLTNPNKRGYDDIDSYKTQLFEALPPGATYLDDDSRTFHVVDHYARFEGQRKDLAVEQVSALDFIPWGLTEPEFVSLLQDAARDDAQLFVASLDEPFSSLLAKPALAGATFRRFPLGDQGTRWVYKLVTATAAPDELALLQPNPQVLRINTTIGAADSASLADRPDRRDTGQTVSVQVRFGITERPFPIRIRWLDPTGTEIGRTKAQTVPAGNHHKLAATLSHVPPAPNWQVQIWHRKTLLKEHTFNVPP